MIAITPAQELTQVRIMRTDANHAADGAHRDFRYSPTVATVPTMAVPSDTPTITNSAAPTRPTDDGSDVNVKTKPPHSNRNNEPAMRAEATQCGTLTWGAGL